MFADEVSKHGRQSPAIFRRRFPAANDKNAFLLGALPDNLLAQLKNTPRRLGLDQSPIVGAQAATSSRVIVASLGPEDICGDIAFLDSGRATAAVVAKDSEVEVDEINSRELREVFEAFPRLASRFYLSLAVILAQRLKDTSRELAREMARRG